MFLLPTQTAIHFWPNYSFVFGVRVDYLSPAIYITDLLFLTLLFFWLIKNLKTVSSDIKRNKIYLLIVLCFILVNTCFSIDWSVSLVKWLKIMELLLFAYYVHVRTDIFNVKNVSSVLFYSLIFFSVIGWIQVIRGETSGGIFYLFGERTFSVHTPGIAKHVLFGNSYLRMYSTFSHPNSLAGYFAASTLFLLGWLIKKNNLLKISGLLIICSSIFLSFSLAAFLGMVACGLVIFINKYFAKKTTGFLILLLSVLISFGFAVCSGNFPMTAYSFSNSVAERVELAQTAGRIFSGNWLVGSGLNTFITTETASGFFGSSKWLMQPVHNIFLLTVSETGLFGLLLLCLAFYFGGIKNFQTYGLRSICVFTLILATGLVDHYWITLQQNMFLLALFFGIFSREK